jgi:hypothetical protein
MAAAQRYPGGMRALPVFAVLGALVSSTTGCGPILSASFVVDAEAKLAAAKASQADTNAIYEYTAAEQYLQKAREELGYADYGPAIDYAFKAADLAQQGAERAREIRSRHLEEAEAAANGPASDASSSPAAAPASAPVQKVIIKKVPATVPAANEGQPK